MSPPKKKMCSTPHQTTKYIYGAHCKTTRVSFMYLRKRQAPGSWSAKMGTFIPSGKFEIENMTRGCISSTQHQTQ